jgi:hypothetical protein
LRHRSKEPIVRAIVVSAAALSALAASPARAQLALSAGVEYFQWTEDTAPIEVKETGALLAVGLDWTQQKPKGWLFAYRGRLYFGDVDYDGALLFQPDVPATGTTRYRGISNEGQVRYRIPTRSRGYAWDLVGSAGFDYWQRELSESQQEDYSVFFVRLGAEINPPGYRGWMFGAGVKYAVWVEENAHLDDEGYDQNPQLEPGGGASAYGQIGYRFNRHFALIGYLDGYNFGESDPVYVTRGGVQYAFDQPASTMYNVGLRLQYLF